MNCPYCGSGYFKPVSELFVYGEQNYEHGIELERNYRCKICEKSFIVNINFDYKNIHYIEY